MVMRADFLRLIFFLDSGRLGQMMYANMEMEIVVEMAVEVVAKMV